MNSDLKITIEQAQAADLPVTVFRLRGLMCCPVIMSL